MLSPEFYAKAIFIRFTGYCPHFMLEKAFGFRFIERYFMCDVLGILSKR
jgi:hypothetical protein